jgi:hypothetical protein
VAHHLVRRRVRACVRGTGSDGFQEQRASARAGVLRCKHFWEACGQGPPPGLDSTAAIPEPSTSTSCGWLQQSTRVCTLHLCVCVCVCVCVRVCVCCSKVQSIHVMTTSPAHSHTLLA